MLFLVIIYMLFSHMYQSQYMRKISGNINLFGLTADSFLVLNLRYWQLLFQQFFTQIRSCNQLNITHFPSQITFVFVGRL